MPVHSMERPIKVSRNRGGQATAVRLQALVGPKMVTFVATVPRTEIAQIGILQAEAELYRQLAMARQQLQEGRELKGWPLVSDWFNHWFEQRYTLGNWYPASQKGSEAHVLKHWRLLQKSIGAIPMDRMTPSFINRAFTALKRTHSATYLRETHKVLCRMFYDAVKFGWDDGYGAVKWRARWDPMDGVIKPSGGTQFRQLLRDDWMVKIVKLSMEARGHVPETHFTTSAIAMQAALGLRVGEAVGLRWENLLLGGAAEEGAAGFLRWRPGERKRGQPLRLPLPAPLLTFLPLHRKQDSGRIWDGHGGVQHMTEDVNTELRKRAAELGLPTEGLSSHSLRHSFAHSLHALGEAVGSIQLALGHANARTTEVYLKKIEGFDETAKAVLPRVAKMFGTP